MVIVIDEGMNVLLGVGSVPAAGNPHYTISQRLAESRAKGSKFACVSCRILTFVFRLFGSKTKDHCTDSMQGMPQDITSEG